MPPTNWQSPRVSSNTRWAIYDETFPASNRLSSQRSRRPRFDNSLGAGGVERITIGPAGNMEVSGDSMLFVTFDDLGRAKAYVGVNRPGANIIAFDVDPDFVEEVRAAAVRQSKGREVPDAPQRADEMLTKDSFGLPQSWILRLEEAAIPGTGRIIEP